MNSADSFEMKPLELEQIANPLVRLAADYWAAMCSEGQLPLWSRFDSLDQPGLIPHQVQINVTRKDGALQFSYHLIGNRIAELYGDVTGTTLNTDEYQTVINEQTASRSDRLYTMVVEQRQACLGRGPIKVRDPIISTIELVALPFVDDAGEICNLVTVGVAE